MHFYPTSPGRHWARGAFTALALLLSACADLPFGARNQAPDFVPSNARGPAEWPGQIRRIALLPAHDVTGTLTAEFVATYDQVWADALQHTQRAEFVRLDRHTLAAWMGRDSIASTDALPSDLLAHIARETGAQAVIFLDVTHCAPYPPLGLGFRAKLVALPDARIIWVADELFDASDAATAHAAEHFAQRNATGPGEPGSAVRQSPMLFSAYAFQAVANLLPPRAAPATTAVVAPVPAPAR